MAVSNSPAVSKKVNGRSDALVSESIAILKYLLFFFVLQVEKLAF